jgi:hypothetical protein
MQLDRNAVHRAALTDAHNALEEARLSRFRVLKKLVPVDWSHRDLHVTRVYSWSDLLRTDCRLQVLHEQEQVERIGRR